MESKTIKEFLHLQEQDIIMSALKSEEISIDDIVAFKVTGPNHYYKRPWRALLMKGEDTGADVYLICATAQLGSWDDIVARRVPAKFAIKIVEEVNSDDE